MSHDQYNNPTHDPRGQNPSGASAYGRDHDANSWGGPVGQPSAGYSDDAAYGGQHPAYPQSQSSAPYAQQPAYGQSQGSAGYPQSQGSAAYGPQGQWQPQAPEQQPAPANKDDNFFAALFDFGFSRYATPTVIKVLYIFGLVVGALYWLGGALFVMSVSSLSPFSSSDDNGVVAGILWFLFGVPVYCFYVIVLRVQLEMMLAMVRTNQDTKAIRAKLDA